MEAKGIDANNNSADHDGPVDLAILIPLKEEFQEFSAEIAPAFRPVRDDETHTYYYRFSRDGKASVYQCVATFVGEMGELRAGLVTRRLLDRWKPKTIVVLGIAAGISNDVMVGDVVAASLVDSYMQNSRASTASGGGYRFELSGEPYRPSGDLLNEVRHLPFVFREVFASWQETARRHLDGMSESIVKQLLNDRLVREKPRIEEGHVASGPTVAAAKSFIEQVVKPRDRRYLALEMESGGVLAAVYETSKPAQTLVIRGISDLGDDRKGQLDDINEGALRRYAMMNATELLWSLLIVDALPKLAMAPTTATTSKKKL